MARSFWVATCPFGWGVGSTESQAVGEMCRAFRELEEEQLDVWLFRVKGYDRVGPAHIFSDSVEAAVCFRGVSTAYLERVKAAWDEVEWAVDVALSEGDREEQEVDQMPEYEWTEDMDGVLYRWGAPSEECRRGPGFTITRDGFRTFCEAHGEYHIVPMGPAEELEGGA